MLMPASLLIRRASLVFIAAAMSTASLPAQDARLAAAKKAAEKAEATSDAAPEPEKASSQRVKELLDATFVREQDKKQLQALHAVTGAKAASI